MVMTDQQRYRRIKAIFQEICDRPAQERSALIDSACGKDLELRSEIEQLLAHQDTPAFDFDEVASELGELLGGAAAAATRPIPLPERIGPYRIIRLIGEGGMGAVYLGEQEHPKRQVAVKVIKAGHTSRDMLRRFEHEAQTLARLQHPGIARIYDAGTTTPGSDGCAYLAMEFVDGAPINEYCDERRLSIDERLNLFIVVGEAVQHAHMRGVLHRDLKPNNILVAEHDESRPPLAAVASNGERKRRPWPRVIDFGVAKALHERPALHSVMTSPGILVGTLAYMSPEQARSDGTDVDVRSDVYSLGVVLYQMLTGCLPVDQERLRGVSAGERERLLWETPLSRPSTRVSRLIGEDDARAERIARSRGVSGAQPLAQKMKGEIDCIVLKALSPERDRRYESVAALIEDVRRYMRDEPVHAQPPSALYLARKFARRNRALVVGAAAFLGALVLGMGGTTWGLLHARAQQERAERESQRALVAEQDAERRAAELEQVVDFQTRQLSSMDASALGNRFREGVLASARIAIQAIDGDADGEEAARQVEALLRNVNFTTVAVQVINESVFDWAIREVESRYGDQPVIQSRLYQTIARTMRDNGLLEQATLPQTRALELRRQFPGNDHSSTHGSMIEMGRLLKIQGRLDEAEELIREGLEGRRRTLGNDHDRTLYAVNVMGFALRAQGRLEEAEPYYREALEGFRRNLRPNHPSVLFSAANMGSLLRSMGRLEEAEPFVREALEGKEARYGRDHIETLLSALDLGLLLSAQGHPAEAEEVYLDTLERSTRLFGDDHFIPLWAGQYLGDLFARQGLLDDAERHYRRALEGRRRTFGDDHYDTLNTARALAAILAQTAREVEASALEEMIERAESRRRGSAGP